MRRWQQIGTFVAVGLGLLAALNAISRSVPPQEKVVFRKMLREADHVEAITIGPSISLAVDFPTLGIPGFQMWTPNSDLDEAWYVLRAAAPALPRLKLVLIAISPISLQWSSPDRGAYDVRMRAYLATGPDLDAGTIDGDWPALMTALALPLVRYDQWKEVFGRGLIALALAPPSIVPTFESDGLWQPIGGALPPDRLQEAAVFYAHQHLGIIHHFALTQPAGTARLAEVVHSMAVYLRDRGVRAVFYIPPLLPEYARQVEAGWEPGFVDARLVLPDILRDTCATYLDFSQAPEVVNVPEVFYDSHHLNIKGARIFSALLRNALDASAPQFTGSASRAINNTSDAAGCHLPREAMRQRAQRE